MGVKGYLLTACLIATLPGFCKTDTKEERKAAIQKAAEEACKKLHPRSTDMNTTGHGPVFCTYFCRGTEDGKSFFDFFPLEDGVACGTTTECLSGTCAYSDDVKICREHFPGLLKYINTEKECEFRCIGDGQPFTNLGINRKKGTPCKAVQQQPELGIVSGTCDDGFCATDQNNRK